MTRRPLQRVRTISSFWTANFSTDSLLSGEEREQLVTSTIAGGSCSTCESCDDGIRVVFETFLRVCRSTGWKLAQAG